MISIKQIRSYLKTKQGAPVVILYHGTRNRRERYTGVIDKVYCNVFTIKLATGEVKSIAYTDVLIKTVHLYI